MICKDCQYAKYEETGWNPFPWIEGEAFIIKCTLDECVFNEEGE